MKPSEINRKMKTHFDGAGTGIHHPRHSNKPSLFDQVQAADIVLTFIERHGNLRVIKDRTGDPMFDNKAPTWYAIQKFSYMISRMIFEENDLKMFQEGLNQEIQKAISNTIDKFHRKRR